MAKQLLIYGSVQAISVRKHQDWSVISGEDYEFARSINSVPVMAAEFPNVASDFTIVFTGDDKLVMPVVIMGFRDGENLYIDDQGKWLARYVPAFLRRYPFVFSSSDNGQTFTLCIDEEFTGCNQEGRGERLFDAEGEQTQYLKNVLEFLKDYQVHYKRTEKFSSRLKELDLLEPMVAQFKTPGGEPANLTGFMAVNREKVKSLSADQLAQLAATDELELIYVHIQSLQNFNRIREKMSNRSREPSLGDSDSGKNTEKKPQKKKTVRKKAAKKAGVRREPGGKTAGKKKTAKKS